MCRDTSVGIALLVGILRGVCGQPFSPKNPLAPPDPKTFTAKVPVHMLPSNKVAFYFDWEIDVGLEICPFPHMVVQARRGGPVSLEGEEELEDLGNMPSPHCSVVCECRTTGDYKCRSACDQAPLDADYCVPVASPGECCHKYICDDELNSRFPEITDFPEAKDVSAILMCTPGSVLPDSVCHSIFPQPFAGNRGPRGVCFDFDDIRCAWLEDNEVVGSEKLIQKNQRIRSNSLKQTMFFQTEPNGTVFDFQFPVKGRKTRPKKLRTMKNTVRKRHSAKKT